MNPAVSSPKILVVGSINVDLCATGPQLPRPGETLIGSKFTQTLGGKGANQAVAAARAGASVDFLGAVGSDPMGHTALAALTSEGVNVDKCRVLPDQPTGVAVIMIGEAAENSIMVVPGANGRVSPEWLSDVDLATYDAVLFQLEIPYETVTAMIERVASINGPKIILTPAPPRTIPTSLLNQIDLLIPNEHEVSIVSGQHSPLSRSQLALQLRHGLIVTLGEKGACWIDDSGETAAPVYPVKAVDTVGAGDCFTGFLAAEWTRQPDKSWALRVASAAASLQVQRPGAQTGIPTLSEVHQFLSED